VYMLSSLEVYQFTALQVYKLTSVQSSTRAGLK
jgi:hypothetical protein